MRHIISILMENEPGALSRVVGLFSQRNFNIETLNVAPTEDETLSRLTVTTVGDDRVIEQITKHLNKLIDVVKLVDLTEGSHIERELMLVKVKALGAARDEVKRTVDIFRAQIVDVTPSLYTVQITGDADKLDAFLQAMAPVAFMKWRVPASRALPEATRSCRSDRRWHTTAVMQAAPSGRLFRFSVSWGGLRCPGRSCRRAAGIPGGGRLRRYHRARSVDR